MGKVSIIGDDEAEIISTVKEFDSKFDLIITSGGIGPTHDDLTYESIAKAYQLDLKLNEEAKSKMYKTYAHLLRNFTKEQEEANLRMVKLPYGANVQYLYAPDLWVPIVNINDKLNILPGIPRLLENMLLNGIHPAIKDRLDPELKFISFYVSTEERESLLAPFLRDLSENLGNEDIKIGSYPHKVLNTVSVTGRRKDEAKLREIVKKCIEQLKGKEISREEEELLSHSSYNV